MTDIVDPRVRSRMMSLIRGRNTRPELLVRSGLWAQGFRFRLHGRSLPGRPDLVLPKWRTSIFVNGCFWHAHEDCPFFRLPASRREFWEAKLHANQRRDAVAIARLLADDWRVITIWECALRLDPANAVLLAAGLIRDPEAGPCWEIRREPSDQVTCHARPCPLPVDAAPVNAGHVSPNATRLAGSPTTPAKSSTRTE